MKISSKNNIRRSYTLPDDLTKGAGVIPVAADTGRILLSLRGPKQESPNTWACWGGLSLIGEDPYSTATRELMEETMYQGNLTLFPCTSQTDPITNFCFTTFIGVLPKEFDPVIDEETSDYEWITMSKLFGGIPNLHKKFKECLIDAKPILKTIITVFDHLNENVKKVK